MATLTETKTREEVESETLLTIIQKLYEQFSGQGYLIRLLLDEYGSDRLWLVHSENALDSSRDIFVEFALSNGSLDCWEVYSNCKTLQILGFGEPITGLNRKPVHPGLAMSSMAFLMRSVDNFLVQFQVVQRLPIK